MVRNRCRWYGDEKARQILDNLAIPYNVKKPISVLTITQRGKIKINNKVIMKINWKQKYSSFREFILTLTESG